MKTVMTRKEDVVRKWYEVDAEGQILGRLSSKIAIKLMGKDKPEYTPHVDTGDNIIVINAEKIAVTGKKMKDKKYYRHSGYPGGLKERNLQELLDKKPEEAVKLAVKRMLPKNRLGRAMMQKLKVYAGTEHPHQAQQPEKMELGGK